MIHFQTHAKYRHLEHFLWNALKSLPLNLTWEVSIGSGKNLMPLGNKDYLSQCWSKSMSPYVTSPQRYSDVLMGVMALQITGVSISGSTICLGSDQRKHQSSIPLAFVRVIHQWPMDYPHKGPVRRKKFPFDDIIMINNFQTYSCDWFL